ncbi:MAG TPA: UDP-N-acetylglucosamine 2-epimerase [Chitinophagaceae bacterium]|jgi:UDP-hydrolysing UDP-N-acetyl-D-glucosamine 2-epimerase|nr:UDP-N-acetylglucosamine 2-epimerase [Chitinophagaceae bacterium]
MSNPLKLCIVTGSRAEYGLFYPLLEGISRDPELQLQLLVTGMHLSPEFGLTYRQIEEDGFVIDEKVEMLLSADTGTAIAKSTGLGVIGYADAFRRLQPDWVVVLGDRFETFAAATAAFLSRLPLAHLHGGELTEGALDDGLRHCITKMAYLHFASTERYRERIIQMGEEPERVFHVGAIGLDNIRRLEPLGREALSEKLGLDLERETLLVTFHPATLEVDAAQEQIENLVEALRQFPDQQVVFTLSNADENSRVINRSIHRFAEENPARVKAFTSLGQLNYLSLLRCVTAVVGNSSSGIIEVPSFGIPTVNIGSRQQGRLAADSVIHTGTDTESIRRGLEQALSPSFRAYCRTVANIYGDGHTAPAILKEMKRTGRLHTLKKSFYTSSL